ncbi:MAG: Ig-like domain-containing protein, partial [Planctomycetota bacterium]
PFVDIIDVNLDSQTTALNEKPFISGTVIADDGGYTLKVAAKDKAENESIKTVGFVIDKAVPVIEISGVVNGSFYNQDVTPVIKVSDDNLLEQTITLNNQSWTSGSMISAEGTYDLSVEAKDKAGNSASQTISWTIDKTPPVVRITSPLNNSVVSTAQITIQYSVEDGITKSENSKTITLTPGTNTVKIEETDTAGNPGWDTITIILDTAPPQINITGAADNSFVNTDVTPVITISDDNLVSQSIKLNGEPFVSGTSITKEGQYTLEVTAEDKAANRITQTIKFIIDKTPPVIISSWPAKASSVPTQGNPLTLNIVFGDALSGIDLAKVKLSYENESEITPQSELSDNNIQFIIQTPVDKEYKFRLYLEDKAGNTILEEISFNVDSTVPKISADVIGGTFFEPVSVQLQCSEEAMIYYSTDGYPPIEGNSNTTAVKGVSAALAAINKTTRLQFFAIDAAGNRSSVKAETYFFNELPAALSGLQGFYNETEKRVELQWPQANPINGYYVYRALNIQEIDLLKDSNTRKYPAASRLRIFPSLVTGNLFYDTNVLSGTTYWYGVSVVDKDGMESPVSELVSVKVEAQLTPADRKEVAKRGLAWIEANQSAQGYWGEKKELRMLSTSQILNALYSVYWNKQPNIWVYRGLFWLRGNFADNNDYLARKIITLYRYRQNMNEEINRLISESDLRGGVEIYGWGVQKRYSSDALTTALGCQAIRYYGGWSGKYDKTITNDNPPVLSTVAGSSDGRYGWVPGKDTSIFVSSMVYYVIRSYKNYTDKSLYQWILDAQNADGSFGKGVIDTAAVLFWIPLDEAAKTKAINYIVSQQSPDGSWNNGDAYVTGLCLEAIIPHGWNGDWDAPW